MVWLAGTYTFDGRGNWKGELITEPYALMSLPAVVFESQTVTSAFPGLIPMICRNFGTGFVGKRSISFTSTMRWLAEA